MKPDWKDAPEWAHYLSMDKNGFWYWYELRPELKKYNWVDAGGQLTVAALPTEWKESLEPRP